MNDQYDDKNIILNQIHIKSGKISFKEVKPLFSSSPNSKRALILNEENKLIWDYYVQKIQPGKNINIKVEDGIVTIDVSINLSVIEDNCIKDTSIYYDNNRIGIGRYPLYSYKFDISVPENKLMTAFHIGDGSYGFSMGNGTKDGFIPEIIGMGSDENDPGLYFIGRAGNNISSTTPLIVIDGRNYINQPLTNRPVFGVKNGVDNMQFIIDQQGRVGFGTFPEIYKMEVNGSVKANDFILDSSISLKNLIIEQNKQINNLKLALSEVIESLK